MGFCKFLLLAIAVTICVPILAQPTAKQKRERMKIVKRISKKKKPLILLNEKKELSVKEYVNLSDSISILVLHKNGSSGAAYYGEKGTDGVISIRTQQYQDSLDSYYRRNAIVAYRQNEMDCFFGNEEPLILFGEHEISRKAFYELPEDSVAFVNFYLTDFVKEYYAPHGKKGIVYVCPRKKSSGIKYTESFPLPANGRNYLYDFGYSWTSFEATGDSISCGEYIQVALKAYEDEIDKSIQATVVVSCVIHTDGTIKPFLVERIETKQALAKELQEKLVRISEEVIRSMPAWQPGYGTLHDIRNNRDIIDEREAYRPISVHFGKKLYR
jgi:hypothetical protein